MPRVRLVAHEALLRWVRPSGIVSPLDFIPLAETSGLIVPIGRWVLRQAVDAVKTGRLQRVSVNVSALEIRQSDFVEHLRGLDGEGRRAPASPAGTHGEQPAGTPLPPVLKEMNVLGVRTALDDFGNGYSSLTALGICLQLVKVDRSFVAGIGEDTPDGGGRWTSYVES